MGLSDRHDARTFRHFARLDANGNVVAIVEVVDEPGYDADNNPFIQEPIDTPTFIHIDITDLHPYDFAGVRAIKANVTARNKSKIRADLETRNKASRDGG